MKRIYIKNAVLVNEGQQIKGSIVIENEQIAEILVAGQEPSAPCHEVIDAEGCYLLPGAIDGHVHFREPGLTQKADITSESRAAAAGGVTSIMDMPNTSPQTTTLQALNEKLDLFAAKSLVNYSCYFGATNNNYPQLKELDPHRVCGVKLFMGSSTGDMLVDRMSSLLNIFGGTDLPIAVHCEDQQTIRENTEKYTQAARSTSDEAAPKDLPIEYHPLIRSEEACYHSTELAVRLAKQANARLHVLHLSTANELELFDTAPLAEKRITAEACVAHLLFDDSDYQTKQTLIKCNPAIKSDKNRQALRAAVNSGLIDVIATDHAPHLPADKEGGALKAASGMPMIQFSLVSMLELVDSQVFSIEKVVEKMCHAPAEIYQINNRGYLRKGYQADVVLVRPGQPWTVTADCIESKCQWSPLEGHTFQWKVEKTFVNGQLVYTNGEIDDRYRGQALRFR
ncbi:dihydroorotase [Bacteroides sp.]|uniref:dihydroorotase n=1 Tax=Bacteroides sp. TaxID=29523 RepID=UPI002FCC5097